MRASAPCVCYKYSVPYHSDRTPFPKANNNQFMSAPRKTIEMIDYAALSAAAPARAGDLAFRRFCTPHLSERRAPNHKVLTERARFHLRRAVWNWVETPVGPVRTYTFAPQTDLPRGDVLIVHGWTSEASFMAVFAEQVRRAGFRAVLIDCPAHGLSPGVHTSLIACARAVASVLESLPCPRFIVAHSMGCLASLLALEGRPPMTAHVTAEKLVLIASPDRFQAITQEHGDILGLTPSAQRTFERHLERLAHRDIHSFRASALLAAINIPTLLIHGKDDHEVPARCSETIAAGCPNAELALFGDLEHRKVLFAPPVIRAAVKFLSAPTPGLRQD